MTIPIPLQFAGLLVMSNVFMTFAWSAQASFKD